MKKKDIIAEYETELYGQKVRVTQLKIKDRKVFKNAISRSVTCPNCLSTLKLNKSNVLECSGDRLKVWETEFIKYYILDEASKLAYMQSITAESRFFELYDAWAYSVKENKPEEFTCGFTNKIFLPIASNRVNVPDPLFVMHVQNMLGRKLIDEEILGEAELWFYAGKISDKYRKGARRVKIPIITLPDDV